MQYVVAAFYKFVRLDNYDSLREPLLELCLAENIRGSILLAHEGVNSTIAGPRAGIDRVLDFLRSDPRLADLEHKESFADTQPFHRMKVRLKREIVTLKKPSIDPNRIVGQYVDAKDWNALISDPETILIDTRNDYEFEAGRFRNAIDPHTAAFSEFPDYIEQHLADKKNAKIVTYCTGGIRCEKATAYLLEQGFKNVYHLKGGILKYLEIVPKEESLWEGECFVFDQRVTVKHGLEQGSYRLCYGCQQPISQSDRQSPHYKAGVCCPKCYHTLTPDRRARFENRQHQIQICASRGQKHIGH